MIQSQSISLVAAIAMLAAVSCSNDNTSAPPPTAKPAPTAADEAAVTPPATADTTPTAAAQLGKMVAGCEASAGARAARQAEKPLYERLGGHDAIMAVTKKIIARHVADDSPIKDVFVGVDLDALAEHVVNFVGAGTGGKEKYTGRTMKDSHAALKLTPEMFLAAGVDIMESLAEANVPQNETEEFMCIILSFKDDVVTM